jgi:hypothetical protein
VVGIDLTTSAGEQQSVVVQNVVMLSAGGGAVTDIVYIPAGNFNLTNFAGDFSYGGVTVSVNSSGALAEPSTASEVTNWKPLAALTVNGKVAGPLLSCPSPASVARGARK